MLFAKLYHFLFSPWHEFFLSMRKQKQQNTELGQKEQVAGCYTAPRFAIYF